MKRTIARKMIDMSSEFRTLGSAPGAIRSDSITRSCSRAAMHHLLSRKWREHTPVQGLCLEAGVLEEACEQLRAHRQRVHEHALVLGVSAGALRAETVEHGNADRGDEI